MAGRIKKGRARVPEGFTLSMAVLDCLPVLFFSISAVCLAERFPSVLFRVGIFLIILAGSLKVSWKMVIALAEKNIPILSGQMRVLMPLGFVLCILALFLNHAGWSFDSVLHHFIRLPSLIFFIMGIAGIFVMIWFAATKDRLDARSNWKEQAVNGVTQFCIMIGIFLWNLSIFTSISNHRGRLPLRTRYHFSLFCSCGFLLLAHQQCRSGKPHPH